MSPQQEPSADEQDPSEIDPIWTSSRTARQIYALGEVEKVSPSHTYVPPAHTLLLGHNPSIISRSIIRLPPHSPADGWLR